MPTLSKSKIAKAFPEEEYLTHPSYGMIQFSRQQGTTRLFASDITHETTISLRIWQGQVKRYLHREWYMAENNSPIIDVTLSETQFATLLTTMNVGFGSPCTIRYREGVGNIYLEEFHETKRELFDKELQKKCREVGGTLDTLIAAIDTLKMTKKDADVLRKLAEEAKRDISQNMPYIQKSFNEAMDDTEADAKAAVEGFISHAIVKLGLDAVTAKSLPKLLSGKKE